MWFTQPEVIVAIIGLIVVALRGILENKKRKDEIAQLRQASELAEKKAQDELERKLRQSREEADIKLSQHQLGLASQLAEQVRTLMDDSTRKMNLLEAEHALNKELSAKNKTLVDVVNRQATNNAERLEVEKQQAEATAANAAAIESLQTAFNQTIVEANKELLTKLNEIWQGWIEGFRNSGEMAQAIQVIRSLPPTLENTEKALNAMTERVDKLPDRDELKTELTALRNHFDSTFDRLIAKLESQNGRETNPQTVDQPAA